MLRIILPQLSVLFSNIKRSRRVSYTYTNILAKHKYEDGEIKIRGFIRLNKFEFGPIITQKQIEEPGDAENFVYIEGIGQIKVNSKNGSVIYIGSWKNSEMWVEKLISDNLIISFGEAIFRGHSYTLCSRDEIITEISINVGNFKINLPVVAELTPSLELFDGNTFSIDINESKPNELFAITKNIFVTSLTNKSVQVDEEEVYESIIIINKDKVTFIRNNLNKSANKSLNFRYTYNLRETPLDFLEKRYLRLPRSIKSISEILASLSQITVAVEN